MKSNQLCDYIGCDETPTLGSVYCSKHEQEEKMKPARNHEFQRIAKV